tara:strand:- start:567 stop:1757 length:1191 start_codon:yes stop_codon:yes gene_type:complete
MTVLTSKPAVNIRSELADLKKPAGLAGAEMLSATTIVEQAALLGIAPKNIIKNGAMAINQRGSVAFVSDGSTAANTYALDRFKCQTSTALTLLDFTQSQVADGPSGFANCLQVEIDTIEVIAAAGDLFRISHFIEGFDIQGLGWGTSEAKSVTLQFWVNSTVPGTYAMYGHTSNGSTIINFTYTVEQADVWQQVVWVIPPLFTSAIDDDNTAGMELHWVLSAGSSFTGGAAAPVWEGYSDGQIAVGHEVDFGAIDASKFKITGVQLTKGSFPEGVPFEHKSFSDDLQDCRRYFQKYSGGSAIGLLNMGVMNTATNAQFFQNLVVEMRSAPAISSSNFGISTVGGTIAAASEVTVAAASGQFVRVIATIGTNFPVGSNVFPRVPSGATGFAAFDAEL